MARTTIRIDRKVGQDVWNALCAHDQELMESFARKRALNDRVRALGRKTRKPQISSDFTEPLAAKLCPYLIGSSARYGDGNDISLGRGASRRGVEVKATGATAFQELRQKDVNADYLVWIAFGSRYDEGRGEVMLHVLASPGKQLGPRKLCLPEFLACRGVRSYKLNFERATLQTL